jgi:hypothetical protein
VLNTLKLNEYHQSYPSEANQVLVLCTWDMSIYVISGHNSLALSKMVVFRLGGSNWLNCMVRLTVKKWANLKGKNNAWGVHCISISATNTENSPRAI